jgi:hypothetical protein
VQPVAAELAYELKPGALGEGCDGLALALVAVFVGSNIRCA